MFGKASTHSISFGTGGRAQSNGFTFTRKRDKLE